MTRIIAGQWGGRRLDAPKGDGTRPTTDRVRESLFASLTSELGGFDGVLVLDLFAGSGALGLEALSRGAARVDFVESDRRAAAVIKRNIAALSARDAHLHTTTAERFLAERFLAGEPERGYDLILLDPPYPVPTADVGQIITATAPWRADDALIVVERSSRDAWQWPADVSPVRDKKYGETTLWYGR